MARKGRRINKKQTTGGAGPGAPTVAASAGSDDAPVDSPSFALQPTQNQEQNGPVLPIEIISMIAELLVDDGKEAWKALVAMSRLSQSFRTASLPVLVREVDVVRMDRSKVIKLLSQPFESVLRHVRNAKLQFEGPKRLVELQHDLLEQAGPNLRSLCLYFQPSPIGPRTAKILKTSLSDRLESLEVIYAPERKGWNSYRRPPPSTMPARFQIPSSLKKIAFQILAEGDKFHDAVEKQIWTTVESLPSLEEWSLTIDPQTDEQTVISLQGFPKPDKASLVSEISGPVRILSTLGTAAGLEVRSIHIWDRKYVGTWTLFPGWAPFARMNTITRLTLEKVELNAPLFQALPPNLEELFLLDADVAGSIRIPNDYLHQPFSEHVRQTLVHNLSVLPEFRLLHFRGFKHTSWRFYREARYEDVLQAQIVFWETVEAPFTVVVERT